MRGRVGSHLGGWAVTKLYRYRPMGMTIRFRHLLGSLLAAAVLQAAAAPLTPPLQDALDRAVLSYDCGQLAQARRGFEHLSRQGVAAADFNLAVMHQRRQLPGASDRSARRLLERAARGGFVTAQLTLARTLESGELGVRDLTLAHRWYAVAAEGGSVEAMTAMGTAHYLGRGAPKDLARAAHWFREAAKGGDVGAQYLLASQYESGEGVDRDLRLARYWYDVAAKNGDEAGPGKVKEMDAKLAAAAGGS